MNARLYDPVLHRFLQPDNYVQDPYNTQNYNRYGYVMNNPLKYTDPSGEEYNNGEGGGLSGYKQSLLAAGIAFIGKNWDKLRIKEWANRNIGWRQFGDGVKSIVKSWSNGIRSIGRGIRRFFGERKRDERPAYVPLPPTPAISNHQLSSGWQNEGFMSTFKENVANIDWKKAGMDLLFGKDDPNLETASVEHNPLLSLLGGGSGSIKGLKNLLKGAAKGGPTIVGEGMKRVGMEAAKHPGSVILNNMPKFMGTPHQVTSQMMTYNRQWLLQQMRSGRPIIDIGLDPTRGAPSIFYQMEQNMMKNYLKLHPNAFK